MTSTRDIAVTLVGIVLIATTVVLSYGGVVLFSDLFAYRRSGEIGGMLGLFLSLFLWRVNLRWCGLDLGSFHRNDDKD